MEAITRNVSEIDSHQRGVFESLLGHPLRDDQRIVIGVVEPNSTQHEETREEAIEEVIAIARRGRAAAAAQGFTSEEVDAAIGEAIRHARRSGG
jgi:hypothetical protein